MCTAGKGASNSKLFDHGGALTLKDFWATGLCLLNNRDTASGRYVSANSFGIIHLIKMVFESLKLTFNLLTGY